MGYARWDPTDWSRYVKRTKTKSSKELFSNTLRKELDPSRFEFRESCDSKENPESTPIIVAVDQTGSMGFLAELLIRKGLGVLVEEIYDRKPVKDPHLMLMALGDAWCDRAPLQATQFEADIRLATQLSKFYIEGNGGGNQYESYNLPWYFAATRTKCDAFDKRNKKGYLFTVGDEPPPPKLLASHVKRFLGGGLQHDLSSRDVLKMASDNWNVYHIMIAEGYYFRNHPDKTKAAWRKLLGQNALELSDHKDLAELIVSTIEMEEGAAYEDVVESWSGSTQIVIRDSLKSLGGKRRLRVGTGSVTRL